MAPVLALLWAAAVALTAGVSTVTARHVAPSASSAVSVTLDVTPLSVTPSVSGAGAGGLPEQLLRAVEVPEGGDALAVAQHTLRSIRAHLRQRRHVFGGAVVHLDGMFGPLNLDPELDSGEPGAVVEWRSAPGARASVSGGTEVPKEQFQPAGSSMPNVVVADLTKLGLGPSDFGGFSANSCVSGCLDRKMDLFFDGVRQHTARFPSVDSSGNWQWAHATGGGTGTFTINVGKEPEVAQHVRSWQGQQDVWVHGYWSWDWADCYRPVASITESQGTITVKFNGTDEVKPNARFYGVNIMSELDTPGEYLITPDGKLYFYPPVPSTQWTENPVVSVHEFAINATGMSHTHFTSLNVTYAQGVGINGQDVNNVNVVGCFVHSHGQDGISLYGSNSAVQDSNVFDTGCCGIKVVGGDVFTLTPGNMSATGNTIYDFAQVKRTYMPGVHWGGVNNVYSDNHVSDAPHNCFLGGGNTEDAVGCLFERNTLERCAFEAADTGAFYTCGQQATAWVNRGHILRNSVFKDIRNSTPLGVQGPSVQAIYLDDQMSGWEVYNNSFYNCQTGTFSGGGRRNRFYNNYYEKCDTAHHFDNRGMNWQLSSCNCTCGDQGCKPNSGQGCDPGGVQYILKSPAGKTYAQTWPELLNVTKDQPCVPIDNWVANNKFCNCKTFTDAHVNITNGTVWNSTYVNNVEGCNGDGYNLVQLSTSQAPVDLDMLNDQNQGIPRRSRA